MNLVLLKSLILFSCVVLLSSASCAQVLDQAIRFTHDNDLYFLTDKQYSAGNHFEISTRLNSTPEDYTSLTFTLGQNIYTPTKKSRPDTTRFDRPFAGWLFLKTKFAKAAESQIWTAQLETGITGPQAYGGKVQRSYHELIGEQLPSWHLQIPNRFHVDATASYRKGFFNNAVFIKSSASLGTKTTFIEQGLGLFWGSHSKFNQNSLTGLARHQDKEWFLSIGGFYHYVFHNSLIEGGLWNKQAAFTSSLIHHKLLLKLKGFYRWKTKSLEFTYNLNSKETPEAASHSFVGITVSHYF